MASPIISQERVAALYQQFVDHGDPQEVAICKTAEHFALDVQSVRHAVSDLSEVSDAD